MSGDAGNRSVAFCFSDNKSTFNSTHVVASVYFPAVFCVLGLTSNLFAFIVLVKAFRRTQSRSRSSFLLFLGALVVTDFMGLLVTGSVVVFFRSSKHSWMDLDPSCHLCNFMGMSMVFYGLSPLLLGAAMAVERFVGINRPFVRSTTMSRSRVCFMVAGVFVTSGCVSLLPLLGLGSYHIQNPGSWCFLNIRQEPVDVAFSLVFSLVGLLSLATSFVLNTTSVVTLLRVCCSQDSAQRKRDYEVEMMVQLIFIMVIATICWCPLLIYIMKTVLSANPADPLWVLSYLRMATFNQICDPWIYIIFQAPRLRRGFIANTVLFKRDLHVQQLLLWIRFATGNQILDPWVYILFRRSVLRRIYPGIGRSRGSIASLYPSFTSQRKLMGGSLGGSTRQGGTELCGRSSTGSTQFPEAERPT